jgi:hypothetical protein
VIARTQKAVALVEAANQRLMGLDEEALQTSALTEKRMRAIAESRTNAMQRFLRLG